MNDRVRAVLFHVVDLLEVGDVGLALDEVVQLIDDETPRQRRSFACPECPQTFEWPGDRDRHIGLFHGWPAEEEAA